MKRDSLGDEVKTELLKIAQKHKINVTNVSDLDSSTPDLSLVEFRGVLMNLNLDTNVSYCFRLAHELSHIIYGDGNLHKIYGFSEHAKRGEELCAHKNAIRLLMKIEKPFSPLSFMEYYKVPAWLTLQVEREFTLQSPTD
ncbi:ImmA/IrrE family metallo-endopeptidase [Leuconostoc mesenteroides]|uniref:ImmA/IrrE family metallo-endopeptidase n=1 Tax=Leuconostoc mesenteroides TaxID=1245 RepID=UPI001CBDE51F|nr:ImmA/IrrE family metallo-endopeptidase [Leuconostoc mesenteroides]MBZ1519200.1 ImmA/IrrE family metallo-endopeptidase [Leuconostoc mesenteroides]MBZ1520966.1 ImmA/IrrE family metallo-endopeptidase [Leuconostoc mesenteroides]MBZ1522867.1 ImmA/IrrE family metallo-endopeptidase [Leuconostoc mesenteroides]